MNNKTSLLVVLGIIVVAVAWAGYEWKQEPENASQSAQEMEAQRVTYRNEEYGFQLTLNPKLWRDYQVEIDKQSGMVGFKFTTKHNGETIRPVTVMAYSPATWARLTKESPGQFDDEAFPPLGKNSQWYFQISPWGEYPESIENNTQVRQSWAEEIQRMKGSLTAF